MLSTLIVNHYPLHFNLESACIILFHTPISLIIAFLLKTLLETYLIILDALYFEETMLKSEAIDISIKGEEFKVFFEKKVTEYNPKEWNTI